MSAKVQPTTAAAGLHSPAVQPLPVEAPAPPPPRQPPQAASADLRLFIRASSPGRYVYTIVDQATGKVISQLPRDEVLRMKLQPHYTAGAVFDGKA